MNMPFLIGAIEGGQIFGICVLVISVLSWLVNAIKGNNPDGVPREKKPAAKPQSGRSEIESLLKQLSGEKPKPQQQQKQQRQEQPQRPAKQQARAKSKPAPPRPTSAASSTSGSSRPMARPGEASMALLAQSNVGSTVRSHHLGNRVDAEVQRDVPAAFLNNFGQGIAAASAPQERQVHPLVKVLRDPNGVRNAILLNEILQRPKSLRR